MMTKMVLFFFFLSRAPTHTRVDVHHNLAQILRHPAVHLRCCMLRYLQEEMRNRE